MKHPTYRVSIWHGENKTVYYVVKYNSDNQEDWEIVSACASLEVAAEYIKEQVEKPISNIADEDAYIQEFYADEVDDLWIRDEVNFLLATLEV